MTLPEFFAHRKASPNTFFPFPGSTRTVLFTSHIWWTELMAFELHRLGYNVLVAYPWYTFFTDDDAWATFDAQFARWVNTIREMKVDLIVGGNTTGMVPHPRTGEMLHDAAGVPLVNYWWDELRMPPPMARRGYSLTQYWRALSNQRSLNVIWEQDVREELERFFGLTNSATVPVGTTPAFWPAEQLPIERRPVNACFIGNLHLAPSDVPQGLDVAHERWARRLLEARAEVPSRTIAECANIANASDPAPTPDPAQNWSDQTYKCEFDRWTTLGSVLTLGTRNPLVQAIADRLGPDFALIGGGWERLGLRAAKPHSGVPGAGQVYTRSQLSLNLPGPCMHSGVTIRSFDIASSNGLLFTPWSRELGEHFEPGKECVAFNTRDEMLDQLDRVLAHPADFTAVAEAGRRRAVAEHTWGHRMARVMRLAQERFDLPWRVANRTAA